MILELLAARRRGADESATAHHQIWTQPEVRAIDQEILLLRSQGSEDALYSLVADEIEQRDRFL